MRILAALALLFAAPLFAQTEAELNKLGYELMAQKKLDEAIAVFARNVREHPRSPNAYDSLAEAYMTAGRRWSAIANYRRALELQPNNEYVFTMLRKLGSSISGEEWAHMFRPVIPPAVEFTPNVVYRVIDDRPLRLHVLRPAAGKSPRPALIFVHGGGWSEGTKERGIVPLLHFVKLGFVGITIDYRFTETATFPAQIDDVRAAIRFVRSHARNYGVDPKRIAIWGQSAGGHLAALAGTMGDVNAVIDWNGPTDFAHDPATNLDESAIFRLFGGRAGAMANAADPVTHVSAGDPPFLILHGDRDNTVPLADSRRLYDALKRAGVDAELKIVEGAGHFGVRNVTSEPPERERIIVSAMETFLRRVLLK
ncbi:MAG TPA: alpha/beta hydrolase fold domain-containing protein [Thermoanaerobaculia bacterium]|nr:alpha/beta hydrolase fold domain-containing protein [Thermoanaerobaculia bacterium]